MTRHTVNLSRARAFSRRKRASKAMKILREELERREEEEVSITSEVNSVIWENGIEKPPGQIEVEVTETDTGLKAVLPGKVEEPEEEETQEEQEDETEGEEQEDEQETDYNEIVSGTVGEAKEQLRELEDPDYEKALEAEKENKDRKTLKEWIEDRV